MKKRVTAILIVLVMLFTMLPGVASADQEYSFNTGKKINGLVNGKALAGSTISFKPYSFIESDERMMEAFFCEFRKNGAVIPRQRSDRSA